MVMTGWYVLYRDGVGHSIRATDDFDAAIVTAKHLHLDGRHVVQLGPLDKERASEVICASEIRRACALMAK